MFPPLPECDCKVHKISWLITNGNNPWFRIDYSTIVIFYLVHAVDDVSFCTIYTTWADNIDLKKYKIKSILRGTFSPSLLPLY